MQDFQPKYLSHPSYDLSPIPLSHISWFHLINSFQKPIDLSKQP
jgi:hypothetical protein